MKYIVICIAVVLLFVSVIGAAVTGMTSEDLFEGRSKTVEERTNMEVIGGHDNNFVVVNDQGACYMYIFGSSPKSSQIVPYYNNDGTIMTRDQYLASQDVK